MLPETAWKATLGELELQMTRATFNTWLKDARLLSCEGNEYVIGVRNDYAKDWLENRLHDTICRTLAAIVGAPLALRFVVWSEEFIAGKPALIGKKKPGKNGHGPETKQPVVVVEESESASPSPQGRALNSHYSFANFIVGDSNRLAHAAALSVAERPGQTYNPLFIYGGVGLGKTHLLQAVGVKCQQNGYTVLYVTSETFTNDLIQSIRSQKTAEFRERYRTPDVLLIDDIQFVAGKESTQEELFHTFNDLHSRGKQVILSSDRPPKAMGTLEERLKSRFEWGLMADIQMPNVETRIAILRAKAEESGLPIPDEVVNVIAHQVRNNIRELEGALNKVVAYAQITGSPVDMNLVNSALSDLIRRPKKVTIERVVTEASRYYGISLEAMHGSSRSRTVAFPRQVAMYLARTETDASFPQIGAFLGNRDHTTILYGYEKIQGMMETDSEIRRDILAIKSALYEAAPV